MKSFTLILVLFSLICFSTCKSTDYARHLELSFLFYEAQRSGPLPKDNRIFWRHDSMLNSGEDEGLDLVGGYIDAGDNVKFNYPMASTISLIAWSGLEFADGYEKAGQTKYLKEMIKWGTDYLIKCHPKKDVLYVAVGDGNIDHPFWYPPEYITYDTPSFKIDPEHPGSDAAGETAAAFTAASLLFKNDDPAYAALLLKHAIELFDFADTYRLDYNTAVPEMKAFYGYDVNEDGYFDEISWSALWLYRATGEESYKEKFEKVILEDPYYEKYDIALNWADKYPAVFVLAAQLFKDEEKYLEKATKYAQSILDNERTPGGLYYCGKSDWGSNRHAANAAVALAFLANILPESDFRRKEYIKFVEGQINYILGDNPLGVNFIVGAEENSPKSVHHRAASCTYECETTRPDQNVFTLYGALTGGPDKRDHWIDWRGDYQRNEVAMDYNAGYTADLAALLHFGLGKKDSFEALNWPGAWPFKAPTPDVRIEMNNFVIRVATGSGMKCGQFCVTFKLKDNEIVSVEEKTVYAVSLDGPEYTLCNGLTNGYLDGKGNYQTLKFTLKDQMNYTPTEEFTFMCDGFYHRVEKEESAYVPEYGHRYSVLAPGGISKTFPLFHQSKCWPASICE